MSKKEKLTYLFVGLAILIGGGAVWYFFFRDVCDPNNKGYTKKGKISDKCFGTAEDPKTIVTPPPTGCQWTSDNVFPLRKCMSGNKVKALQTALGIGADGKFGSITEGAVFAKLSKNEVSQADYDKLINPATVGGGLNFSQLKEALKSRSQNFSGGIKTIEQGQNQNYQFEFYTNGRVIIFDGQKKEIRKGNYLNGGKEIILTSGGDEESEQSDVYATLRDIVQQIEN